MYLLKLILCTLAFTLSTPSLAWELEKDQDGIRVYTKDITDSSFKAFRGETIIQASLKSIIAHHIDVESMSEWLQDCSESTLISKLNDFEYIVYQRTEAPWPVSDRDYVYKSTITQDPDTFAVTMTFEASSQQSVHDDECVQVTQLNGFWRFTPQEEGKVYVEYETHADPSGDLPAWLANSFVVDQPFGTLTKLKQRILDNTSQPKIDLEFIRSPPETFTTTK